MTPFVGGAAIYDGMLGFNLDKGEEMPPWKGGEKGVPLSCAEDLVTISSQSGVTCETLRRGLTPKFIISLHQSLQDQLFPTTVDP